MNNLEPFLSYQNQTRILLSINPRFADKIMCGEKKYEFRRTIFSRKVDIVVLYVTFPVKKVIAEFDIVQIICSPLDNLWNVTNKNAGIDRAYFYKYFFGKEIGYAIEIGSIRTYEEPFSPVKKLGLKPPQSFLYI